MGFKETPNPIPIIHGIVNEVKPIFIEFGIQLPQLIIFPFL